jgi:putative intracellular protease/amidase
MVVTSHPTIDSDHPTGLWFEEFSVPYALFREQGYQLTVASPLGGETPIDPRSLENYQNTPENQAAKTALLNTLRLDSSVSSDDYSAIFFPGGHGTMFDLPENPAVQRLVSDFLQTGKVVAAVCHGPACLVGARLANGAPLVEGRKLTSFTDAEERAVELDQLMPFLLQSRLTELGAEFQAAENWQDHVVVDNNLVTGQNPQSSASCAKAVTALLSAGDSV